MNKQKTIEKRVSLTGVSITGEREAKVCFCPAPPNTGIVFIRGDLPHRPKVKCCLKQASVEYRWSSLIRGAVRIEHTEHVLASVSGLDIDNLIIELAQPSVPVMPDYSSKDFTDALLSAGIIYQPFEQRIYRILKPIVVHKQDASLIALPFDGFKLTYALDYPQLPLLAQTAEININPENFIYELAAARSFIIESEIEEVRRLTGDTSSNVLVVKAFPDKERWLWPNELARHKALDLLGDLRILGTKLLGHIIGIRSGHRLNLAFCKKIYKELNYGDQ